MIVLFNNLNNHSDLGFIMECTLKLNYINGSPVSIFFSVMFLVDN